MRSYFQQSFGFCSAQLLSLLIVGALTLTFLSSCQRDEQAVDEPPPSVEPVVPTAPPAIEVDIPAAFQAMLTDINDLRAQGCRCGGNQMPPVGPLRWNKVLAEAAAQHSGDMSKAGRLNHTGTDGSTAGDRIKHNGYSWRSYGENIAQGYDSAEAALQGWIASPGHCQNLMKADFTEIGVAEDKRFWTQVFARPF